MGVNIASAALGGLLGVATAGSPLTEQSTESKISQVSERVAENIDGQKLFEYNTGSENKFSADLVPKIQELQRNELQDRLNLIITDKVGEEFDPEAITTLLGGNEEVMLPQAQIEEIVTEVAKARNTPLEYVMQFASMFLMMLMGRLYLRRKDSEASESNKGEATPNETLG